jgi:hypothetical protein
VSNGPAASSQQPAASSQQISRSADQQTADSERAVPEVEVEVEVRGGGLSRQAHTGQVGGDRGADDEGHRAIVDTRLPVHAHVVAVDVVAAADVVVTTSLRHLDVVMDVQLARVQLLPAGSSGTRAGERGGGA